mmetsp:Transcript_120083/g.231599  ORF Transcript_120083/g.231599 Transcript_120083/m.231599 type:complete len:522 (-) Transcript_120083:191-1756(-)
METSPSEDVDVFSGKPLPMTNRLSLTTGSYSDVVVDLRVKLENVFKAIELPSGGKFEVAVFGHGGRDTNCCLALVEAVAGHEMLRSAVKITHCTCSWADDEWEAIMASFLKHLVDREQIAADAVDFQVMKYHEEVGVLVERLKKVMDGKHCIVQCEQGVDMFVEPITGEWLQDNFEDFTVHNAVLAYAERASVPAFLLQTNADLDLARGIDGDDVSTHVFGGRLQMRGVFCIDIEWKDAPAKDLIGLALIMNRAPDKASSFLEILNFNVLDFDTLSGFYARYIAYAASLTNAQLPVAGVVEVMNSLIQTGHELPFRITKEMPKPQWCAAQFLQPADVENGSLRVVSQFRKAAMDSAPTFAVLFSRWMFARSCRRVRGVLVSGRCNKAFWQELEEAKVVAEEVKSKCLDFNLWPDDKAEFLQRALERMAEAVKISFKHWQVVQEAGKKGQHDYGELSPLWKFCSTYYKMFLDFVCRLLESPLGIEEEYAKISSGLEPLEVSQSVSEYAKLFQEAIVAEWLAI